MTDVSDQRTEAQRTTGHDVSEFAKRLARLDVFDRLHVRDRAAEFEIEYRRAISPPRGTAMAQWPVNAPAVGILDLKLQPGDLLSAGSEVGTIQMHRKQVHITIPEDCRLVQISAQDGAFVEYQEPLMFVVSSRVSETAAGRGA